MQQVWSSYDASQSMQEVWLIQQERNHCSGLIPKALFIQGLDYFVQPLKNSFSPILAQINFFVVRKLELKKIH